MIAQPDDLSPRRGEYLKFILERGGTVRPSELAARFEVDPSTVTKSVHALASRGLVRHEPYRGVILTDRGCACAEFLVRRHRILGLILQQHGFSPEEACDQATRMEMTLPPRLVDTLCASLGHPRRGICGEIPRGTDCCGAKRIRRER